MEIEKTPDLSDILFQLSEIINTGLDREKLNICIEIIKKDTNPESLAMLIKELNFKKGN